ncbi:MAG TPA: carbohydrate porin [Rudaea sp.]|jgi:hypothetical protein|uniref:carbohydrate porin n=1 Tax=Rudaea sp. TaxID=2136325 RepID=UPI002F939DD6
MRQNLIAAALVVALGGFSAAAHADVNTVAGGVLFIDFTHLDQTALGKDTAAAGTGLDVKRGYLTIDHKFDDFWSANITTDFNYVSADSETQLFIKKAWLQAKWLNEFAVRIGSDDQPWIGFVDGLSGLRYVENSLVDKSGFGNSADWGIHVLGTGAGNFWNYNAAVTNGAGYKNPTRSNSVDFEGRVGIQPLPGLMLAVGGYSGELGKDVANLASTSDTRTFTRFDAVAAYNTSDLRLGAEYFSASNNKNNIVYTAATGSPLKDSSEGYSAWGWFSFTKDWAVFARYDHTEPNQDTVPSLKEQYEYLGLEFVPRKGIKIAGVYKHDTLKNALSTTNTKSDEIGLWAEVKF